MKLFERPDCNEVCKVKNVATGEVVAIPNHYPALLLMRLGANINNVEGKTVPPNHKLFINMANGLLMPLPEDDEVVKLDSSLHWNYSVAKGEN